MSVIQTEDFILKLMTHLIRCPSLTEKACSWLTPEDFTGAGEGTYAMVWDIVRTYFGTTKAVIPQSILITEIKSRLEAAPSAFSEQDIACLWVELDLYYSYRDDELNADWMLTHLKTFLDERRLKPVVQALAGMAAGDDFDQLLDKLQTMKNAGAVQALTEDDLYKSSTLRTKHTIRTETGVNHFDKLVGGGTLAGELYGVLAPTGCGKTVTGVQLFIEGARRERHVGYFSYETEIESQISNRIYAMMGDIPRDIFKTLRNMDDMPTAHHENLKAKLDKFGKYMHTFDMKKCRHKGIGIKGPMEIRDQLKEYDKRGQHIELVVIDQMLSMVDPYIIFKGGKLSDKRLYMQDCNEQLRDLAESCKCALVVLHQTDNPTKRYAATRKPRMGEAAEDKGFENNMHFAVQYGTIDTRGRAWLVNTKHRESAAEAIIVQHSPTHWKVEWEPDRFTCEGESFVDHRGEQQGQAVQSMSEIEDKPKIIDIKEDV